MMRINLFSDKSAAKIDAGNNTNVSDKAKQITATKHLTTGGEQTTNNGGDLISVTMTDILSTLGPEELERWKNIESRWNNRVTSQKKVTSERYQALQTLSGFSGPFGSRQRGRIFSFAGQGRMGPHKRFDVLDSNHGGGEKYRGASDASNEGPGKTTGLLGKGGGRNSTDAMT